MKDNQPPFAIHCPSNIEVLLHCHCYPVPHPRLEGPAVRDAIKMFRDLGAIEERPPLKDVYATTLLGRAWVEALCMVPPPRLVYLDEQGRTVGKG